MNVFSRHRYGFSFSSFSLVALDFSCWFHRHTARKWISFWNVTFFLSSLFFFSRCLPHRRGMTTHSDGMGKKSTYNYNITHTHTHCVFFVSSVTLLPSVHSFWNFSLKPTKISSYQPHTPWCKVLQYRFFVSFAVSLLINWKFVSLLHNTKLNPFKAN